MAIVYHVVQLPLFTLTRVCPACGIEKTYEHFSSDKYRKNGMACYCRPCNTKRSYASAKKHPGLLKKMHARRPQNREYDRKYLQTHLLQHAERQRRRSVKKKGVSVGRISYKRILERDGRFCYICERDILPNQVMTFDHKVPLNPRCGEPQGLHIEDNLHPAHSVCNSRKSNRPFEDMLPFDRRGP